MYDRNVIAAWWMNDNHTFKQIDMTKEWIPTVIELYKNKRERGGTLFVRDKPDGERIFTAHTTIDNIEEFTKRIKEFDSTLTPIS